MPTDRTEPTAVGELEVLRCELDLLKSENAKLRDKLARVAGETRLHADTVAHVIEGND